MTVGAVILRLLLTLGEALINRKAHEAPDESPKKKSRDDKLLERFEHTPPLPCGQCGHVRREHAAPAGFACQWPGCQCDRYNPRRS